jgi:hypothetical protein
MVSHLGFGSVRVILHTLDKHTGALSSMVMVMVMVVV